MGRSAGFHCLYVEQERVAESEVELYVGGLMSKAMGLYLQGQEG